jgi:hypothetical protein
MLRSALDKMSPLMCLFSVQDAIHRPCPATTDDQGQRHTRRQKVVLEAYTSLNLWLLYEKALRPVHRDDGHEPDAGRRAARCYERAQRALPASYVHRGTQLLRRRYLLGDKALDALDHTCRLRLRPACQAVGHILEQG